jgi:outer membrane receptor for ferrienterochelin and colicin
MQKALLLFVFICSSILASAQTGSISGTITDAKAKEAIIGGSVLVQGTQVGTSTDIDGKFTISNLKPGTYNLQVSYVAYKTALVSATVEAGKTTEIQINMEEESGQLEEVVITGTRSKDTDISIVRSIRESKLVVNGISAQQISKSQDRDAAQVVRRVPGVTLVDDRFVVVRGLASRYSNVMLNGVLAPSTEADSRAFSFDIIPSGLLDRMMVYKSGAAELPGDFAGSIVEVSTKSAAEENFTNISLSGGYRAGTSFTTQQSQQRSSTEWLTFDNGFRDLPKDAPADYSAFGNNAPKIELESRKFANTWGLENVNVGPDVRFGVDLGRNFDLGSVGVSSINSVSYSRTSQYNNIEFNRYQNYEEDGTSVDFFNYKDDQFTQNARIGLLSNWSFRVGPKTRIEFKNLYNRMGSTQTTIREGDNDFRTQYYRNYSFRYTERAVYSGQLEGRHDLKPNVSKITWLAGYTNASRNEPDWKRLVTARPQNSGDEVPFVVVIPYSTSASNAAHFYQNLNEYNVTNRLDYEHKFNVREGVSPFELKTGYWIEYKDRSFDARTIGHVVHGAGLDPEIGNLPFDEIFDPSNVAYNGGHTISENTQVTDSYTASNFLAAGYASFNFSLSKRLHVIPGVRVEYNHQKLQTAEGVGSAKVDNPVTSFLPFLNMSYDLNDKALVRLAYSKTVNRPEFREIAPFSFYDFDNQANILGNSHLTIADIHNIDLRWEYYPSSSESISAGVFYKYFNNPIEANIDPGTDDPVFFFNNADKAQDLGVEVEMRKALASSSSMRLLNNTSVVLNATYIYSVINLKNDDGTLVEKDSRPMQGQSPYIVNAGLFYNDEELGLQVNAQYNIFGKRIAFVGVPGKPTWWEMPRNLLDLSISKRVGQFVDIRLGVSDLLNSKMVIREDANLDNDLKDNDTNKVVRSTRNGQYITFGVVVKL